MANQLSTSKNVGPSSRYLISLQSERSRKTMKSVLNQVAVVLGHSEHDNVPWNDIDTLHINATLTALKTRRGLSPGTLNLYLSAIKGVFKQGWHAGAVSFENYQRIAAIPHYKGKRVKVKRKQLTPMLVAELIDDALNMKTLKGYRNAAIMGIMAYCGLRRDEVSNLRISDIDLVNGELLIRGKGDKERLGFLNEEASRLLEKWFSTLKVSPYHVFFKLHKHNRFVEDKSALSGNAIYEIVKRHGRNVGLPSLHPHELRSYFGTTLIDNGIDIVTVRDLMGHESFATTEIYIRRDKDKLKSAVNTLKL